ncbi:hypothetical protein GmRootV35_59980 [Variovorax sp. V35]|nr:type IV secretory pathway VirD2 relaxase [Variovorax paradoxus]
MRCTWAVHADAEKTLRTLGERGDIIRTMQRAMSGDLRVHRRQDVGMPMPKT